MLIDIETFPNVGYSWDTYETNIIDIVRPWYILCVGYQWLGKKTHVVGLPNFEGYKPRGNDKELTKFIWELLNETDITVGQNSDKFDLKSINTRFIYWGLTPPAPYKSVDVLKTSRKYFRFPFNSLDKKGKFLNIGKKLEHKGFPLWLGCEDGNMSDWRTMKKYCGRDVDLLKLDYLRERPWMKNHPNLDIWSPIKVCPRCSSKNIINKGYGASQTYIFQKYVCKDCGGWGQYIKGKRKSSLKSI